MAVYEQSECVPVPVAHPGDDLGVGAVHLVI
jgi:hypothetical protein